MPVTKRERSANFTPAEVNLLLSLVEQFKDKVENKKTDAFTNKIKDNAWKQIRNMFNSYGVSGERSEKTLKLKYEGLKKHTKKKSTLHGNDESCLDDVEEKVLSICSDIKGLQEPHDSSLISSRPMVDTVHGLILEPLVQQETENTTGCKISTPGYKSDRLRPKELNSRPSNGLNSPTKPTVLSKLNKLSEARLELVQLQIQNAKQEHELKMSYLTNDERRKEEIHALLMEKICEGLVPSASTY